ncbi:hypothetical protein [Syntrophomonas wolfei]|uniref:hypothetical protein n=2 Tax=Eubacteriales TaxID=186802 RepID=UPI0023EF9A73|nr:hypothetical protein [Syntrophomonas wolfei]
MVENKDHFMEKWRVLLSGDDLLKVVTAKRFIQIFSKAEPITEVEVELYFKMVEKITIYDAGILVVSLLDGAEVECETE